MRIGSRDSRPLPIIHQENLMSPGHSKGRGQSAKGDTARRYPLFSVILLIILVLTTDQSAVAEDINSTRARARDLGIVIGTYQPGPQNAITDVAGVKVGHVALIQGEGKLMPGKGPVR